MRTKVGWHVDIGRQRQDNQDFVATATLSHPADPGDPDKHEINICVVADGMGGHQAGDLASQLAARTALRQFIDQVADAEEALPQNYQNWLRSAASIANKIVYRRGGSLMGTTLVMAVVVDNNIHIVNIGDSRAYLVTRTQIRQITKDHTMVQLLLDSGAIQPEDAVNNPRRNILTRSVGMQDTVEIDTFEEQIDEPCHLLLCSDGLWSELSEEQMCTIVNRASSVQEACQALVDASNHQGGSDNIAVVLARLEPEN